MTQTGLKGRERAFDRLCHRLVGSGRLSVRYPSGAVREYGDGSGDAARFHIRRPQALVRIALNPEFALGEAWMEGDITLEHGDLGDALTQLLKAGGAGRAGGMAGWLRALRRLRRRLDQFNPAGRARRNVAHHYDLDDGLFDLVLDADKQYSCAYFEHEGMGLEAAQAAKKNHIAGKLCLQDGQRVLDIGCGWGGMALTLARQANVSVLGVTLSQRQLDVARQRAEAAGLSGRVRFELVDYRALEGRFDRIVSVGMFEHVGIDHYREFFETVRGRLAPGGIALIHSIGRMDGPGYTNPWLAKYIFPGGYIPALSETLPHVERAGLLTGDIEVLRLHYARTLQAWRRRSQASRERIEALYDRRFFRMWEFYLASSEAAFRSGQMMVFQLQLLADLEAAPLTRDYMYTPAARQAEDRRAA
ncbi:MAG: methyltransferase domain-containing protein [Alphaproteobacteria bacterium]|jgi:cyclopropane-fatty-acyl-phospholipid synthase|nr:methyltransferase domain-containing protein [Alphaproteobacteria bacterium]